MVFGHLRHTDNCHVTASKQQYIFQYFNNYTVVYQQLATQCSTVQVLFLTFLNKRSKCRKYYENTPSAVMFNISAKCMYVTEI